MAKNRSMKSTDQWNWMDSPENIHTHTHNCEYVKCTAEHILVNDSYIIYILLYIFVCIAMFIVTICIGAHVG